MKNFSKIIISSFIVFLFLSLSLFSSKSESVFALPIYGAGFYLPATCETNGSSCENMKEEDDKYNSWVATHDKEVVVKFTGLNIPEDVHLFEVQLIFRIRSSIGGIAWGASSSVDGGITYNLPLILCRSCKYYTTTSFNSIASSNSNYPTLSWKSDYPGDLITGKDVKSGKFALKFHQLPYFLPSTFVSDVDIDVLLFNVKYIVPYELTPTPPPAPSPFLDLPWDYEGKGLSFNEAALSMTSYFDHTYPLLSSGLSENSAFINQITTFQNENSTTKQYSSHDGYDYGRIAKANFGDSVLAAADGCASYTYSSLGGHIIKIDHDNYYQTRYLHLQDTKELITKETTSCIEVVKGQQIGLVGSTGNSTGAHIHFGVVEDKNKDGNFDDNVPDGVTDPFGWQSKEQDPWQIFSFFYNGLQRTGNRSYYLWNKKLDSLDSALTANGAVFDTGRYQVEFPEGATDTNLNLNIQSAPIVETLGNLVSIGTTLDISAYDLLGNLVTSFQKLFDITVDFSSFDLTRYNTDTLSIYSSTDGASWAKEPTIVDLLNQTATTQVDHLTQFALMAERLDTIPPTTTAVLSGEQGQINWYRSDVLLTLNAEDNENGLGVDYTLFKIDGKDWETYTSPLVFTQEGHHKIEFYSVDKDENIEEIKSVEFDIDISPPEIQLKFDPQKKDIVAMGTDASGEPGIETTSLTKNNEQITMTDKSGNILIVIETDRDHGPNAVTSISSLSYNGLLTTLDSNKLRVQYSLDKDGGIKIFKQSFEIKGAIKIQLDYDPATNTTTITKDRQDRIEEGMKILQISTEKGTLNYSY